MGFMVHERGIEIGQKSIKAIDEAFPPTTKTELQSLLGKINFMQKIHFKFVEKDPTIFSLVDVKK